MRIWKTLNLTVLLICTFALFLISSCGDKEYKTDPRQPRLKQINYSLIYDTIYSDSSTINFHYNDKNLLSSMAEVIYSDSMVFQYSPEGKISKTKYFSDSSDFSMDYAWSGNKVTITQADMPQFKIVFEHNTEGQIVRMES